MASNHSKAKKSTPLVSYPNTLVNYAEPVQELLHATAVFGAGFERRVSATLLQETVENAASLHVRMSITVKLVKRLTRGDKRQQVKEAIEFLTDLRNDFHVVSMNANDALDRSKGGRHA